MEKMIGEFEVLPKSPRDQALSFVLIFLLWVVIGASFGVLSGCALMTADYMEFGTEKGIRAASDRSIGLATSREPVYYHKQRNLQETESTARYMKPTLFEGLFTKRAK